MISRIVAYYTGALLLCGLLACSSDPQGLAAYYYPTSDIRTYVYVLNDSLQRQYYQIHPRTPSTWRIDVYNDEGQLKQQHTEASHKTGITQEKITLFKDSTHIHPEIEANFIYPFEELDNTEVAVYKISWLAQDSSGRDVKYTIIRNRRFAGHVEIPFAGEVFEGVAFKYSERIISDQEGQIEIRAEGRELYAKGVGLIRRERVVNDIVPLVDRLIEVRGHHVY